MPTHLPLCGGLPATTHMTCHSNDFPFAQHIHAGSEVECVLVESSIQELLLLGSDLLLELVDLYISDAAERVQVAVDSFAAGDPGGVSRSAHALKSSSANMGALAFGGVCGELQRLGDDGNLASMEPWIERFQCMYVEVKQALIALRVIYQD